MTAGAGRADLGAAREKLARGDLQGVLGDVAALLEGTPDDIDALYLQAVALRYAGRPGEALATLDHLKALAPSHARAHQEEGHLYRDTGHPEAALAAYARAVALNPALAASLRESISILEQLGRHHHAGSLRERLDQLQRLPKTLVAVMELVAQDRLLKAEALCRAYLQRHPRDVRGMRLLADIGARLGVLDEAEFLLESAVAFEPDNLDARLEYVQVLRKRQKFEAALAESKALLARQPESPRFKSLCAIEHMQSGDFDTAVALLDEVLTRVPDDPATLVTKGHALKTRGDGQQAVQCYRAAYRSHRLHGEAYYALANLKTYRFTDEEVAAMQALQHERNLGYADRIHVEFALAKAYEDRADYARAFACYANGNRLKKAQSRYDGDVLRAEFAATREVCTRELFDRHARDGDPAPDPIFVVGLPRAGSTLIEQILSSHSEIDGTLELPNVLSLVQRLRRRRGGGGYPDVLRTLSGEALREFGREYIEGTRIHRAGGRLFIDKMPNNFRHIGLIKLMLPNARVIDARREPMACCFSGFKQLFAEGQEFSYDLTDIGRYYRDYVDLMAHWDEVLPGFVLRVQHEELVADLEGQVRRMLAFCGVRFEPACLQFHQTERNVRTPSSEQVRRPIFRDGLEQWRNFDPWLGPLRSALGELASHP